MTAGCLDEKVRLFAIQGPLLLVLLSNTLTSLIILKVLR